MPAVTHYITRISYLLRQGQPANQVAILLPTDDAWASFSPTHVTVTGAMQQAHPAGADVRHPLRRLQLRLHRRRSHQQGRPRHPPDPRPPAHRPHPPATTLSKIAACDQVRRQGHRRRPRSHPSTPKANPLRAPPLSALFDPRHPSSSPATPTMPDALHNAAAPDLKLGDPQLARRTRSASSAASFPTADIYFVANTSNQPDRHHRHLRHHLQNRRGLGPRLRRLTSAASPSSQPLHLAPYESRVFVFSDSGCRTPALPADSMVSATGGSFNQVADLSAAGRSPSPPSTKPSPSPPSTDWIADPSTQNYSGEAVYSRDFTLDRHPGHAHLPRSRRRQALPGAPNSPPPRARTFSAPTACPTRSSPAPAPACTPTTTHPSARPPSSPSTASPPERSGTHPTASMSPSSSSPAVNHIEIHVYNTALNAWSALPPHDYDPLIAKYGDRFQMQDLQQGRARLLRPPRPSPPGYGAQITSHSPQELGCPIHRSITCDGWEEHSPPAGFQHTPKLSSNSTLVINRGEQHWPAFSAAQMRVREPVPRQLPDSCPWRLATTQAGSPRHSEAKNSPA